MIVDEICPKSEHLIYQQQVKKWQTVIPYNIKILFLLIIPLINF
jgi:hypothetical protein